MDWLPFYPRKGKILGLEIIKKQKTPQRRCGVFNLKVNCRFIAPPVFGHLPVDRL